MVEDLDFSPREVLVKLVEGHFPTTMYIIDENGDSQPRPNPTFNPDLDESETNIRYMQDPAAIAAKNALLVELQGLPMPEGALEQLFTHTYKDGPNQGMPVFTFENTGEVTGRVNRKYLSAEDLREHIESRGNVGKATRGDATMFMDDELQVLVYSGKGGTGSSYHSSLGRKNQRKRQHYMVQAGYRADVLKQIVGRGHRGFQRWAPHIVMVTSELPSQMRFTSSIARKLDSMGALSGGQRETGGQGMYGATDNLDTDQASYAKESVFLRMEKKEAAQDVLDLFKDEARELSPVQGLAWKMGLHRSLLNEQGEVSGFAVARVRMDQFLNRILMLTPEEQNAVFSIFQPEMKKAIAKSIADGSYDVGMETIRGVSVKKTRDDLAHTDSQTGAEIRYVSFDVEQPTPKMELDSALGWGEAPLGIYRNQKSKRVSLIFAAAERVKGTATISEHASFSLTGSYVLIPADSFSDKMPDGTNVYEPLSLRPRSEEAEQLWETLLNDMPPTITRRTDLLTGQVLSVWDKIPTMTAAIVRARDSETGERFLGLKIPLTKRTQTQQLLGLDTTKTVKITNEEALRQVREEGAALTLSGEQRVERRVFNGEERVELRNQRGGVIRGTPADREALARSYDLQTQIVDYQTRFFFPQDPAAQLASFEKLMERGKILRVTEKKKTAEQVENELPPDTPSTFHSEGPEGTPPLGSDTVRRQLKQAFTLDDEQADAAMAILHARAATWAETTNLPAEEWFDAHIDRIIRSDVAVGEGDAKASTTFTEDRKALIRGMQGATIADFIHEIGHVFQREISQEDRQTLEDYLDLPADARWTQPAAEKFAEGFQGYMMQGRAPVAALQRVFNKFKTWLTYLYEHLTGGSPSGLSASNVTVSPELTQVFDNLLSGAVPIAERQQEEEDLAEDFDEPPSWLARAGKAGQMTFGNYDEWYKALLGKAQGQAGYNQELLKQIIEGAADVRFSTVLGKVLTHDRLWDAMTKVVGERGATFLSRTGRALPGLGKYFGVPRKRMAALSDAVEGVKDMDENRNKEFGTKKFFKKKDGTPVLDENDEAKWEWRFSPAEAEANWNALSELEQEAAEWWIAERKHFRSSFQIVGEVEGYIRHYFDNDFFGASRTMLKKRYAGSRRMRTEAEGYIRNFEDAILKNWQELNHEQVFNDFIVQFAQTITLPIPNSGQIKDGWRRIPRIAEVLRDDDGKARVLGQIAGGRQIPIELWDHFAEIARGGKEVSELAAVATGLGRAYKTNLLLHPGTAMTNFLSGGLQFATKMIEDFWRGMMRGLVRAVKGDIVGAMGEMQPFLRDVMAPLDALRPSVIRAIIPEMFGARSNIQTQFGPSKNFVDRLNSMALWHYGAIENYWKRVIASSSLRSQGLAMDRDTLLSLDENGHLVHGAALMEMNQAVDTWAFNYRNEPAALERFKQHPLGAFILPFPTYALKVSRMYGRYLRPLFAGGGLPASEIGPRLATLGTIMAMAYMADILPGADDDEEKVGPFVTGMPFTLDRTGRVRLGNDHTKETWMRTIKYPWMQMIQGMNGAAAYALGRKVEGSEEVNQALADMMSEGPLLTGFMYATGHVPGQNPYAPSSVRWGELAAQFVPGFRMTQGIQEKGGLFSSAPTSRRYATTFWEAVGRGLPDPIREAVGISEPGKLAYERDSGRVRVRDPELEFYKFWFGINLKDIPWRKYRLKSRKILVSAITRAQGAESVDQLRRAIDVIATLDPKRAARMERQFMRREKRLLRLDAIAEARELRRAAQARERVAPPDQIAY
jgi:hypothetical protein